MPRHPAKFTDILLETMYPYIPNGDDIKLLDPFAGTGKIALIKELGFKGKIYANDLESEWLSPNIHGCDFLTYEDAETLDYPSEFFDCVCTSPTYGNRMADHHNAKDGSVRMTYTHCLGRPLHDQNTGSMQFGQKYIQKHERIWRHLLNLLKNGGAFIVNAKNFVRKGKVVDVVGEHLRMLESLGLKLERNLTVETPSMRYGRNSAKRIPHENILIMRKGEFTE